VKKVIWFNISIVHKQRDGKSQQSPEPEKVGRTSYAPSLHHDTLAVKVPEMHALPTPQETVPFRKRLRELPFPTRVGRLAPRHVHSGFSNFMKTSFLRLFLKSKVLCIFSVAWNFYLNRVAVAKHMAFPKSIKYFSSSITCSLMK